MGPRALLAIIASWRAIVTSITQRMSHILNFARVDSDGMCAAPAAPQACPQVLANTTNITFYLNTSTANWTEAEEMCKRNGGHLAAFSSLEEQVRCCLPGSRLTGCCMAHACTV